MKLGLIVECTRKGMEETLCPRILELLAAEVKVAIECKINTMTNKELLIKNAAEAAKILLRAGRDRVVILWDENPPWTPDKAFADERNWRLERNQLLENLKAAGVPRQKIGLVCIEREFETWLLHDHDLLLAVLQHGTHKPRLKRIKDPVRIDRPKRFLDHEFSNNHGRYNRDLAASNMSKNLVNLKGLQRCDTFRYFVQNVLGKMPNGWKPYNYKSKCPHGK